MTHGTGTRGRTERLCTRSCPGPAPAAALGGNTADLGAPLLSRWGNRGTAAPIGTGTAGREQRRGIAGKGALRDAFLAQQSGSMFPMNRKPAGRQNSSPRRPLPGTQIRVCGPHSPAQPRTAQPQRCRLRDPPFLAQPPFPAVPLFTRAELRKSAGKTPEGSGWIALGGKGKGLPPPPSPPPRPAPAPLPARPAGLRPTAAGPRAAPRRAAARRPARTRGEGGGRGGRGALGEGCGTGPPLGARGGAASELPGPRRGGAAPGIAGGRDAERGRRGGCVPSGRAGPRGSARERGILGV